MNAVACASVSTPAVPPLPHMLPCCHAPPPCVSTCRLRAGRDHASANALPQQVSALCPTPPPLTPLTAACTALLLCQSFLPSHPTHPIQCPRSPRPFSLVPSPIACTRLPKSFNPEGADHHRGRHARHRSVARLMATMEEVVGRGANPDNIRIVLPRPSPALPHLSSHARSRPAACPFPPFPSPALPLPCPSLPSQSCHAR
ncbi:unnamed protein product [Closterium sp. NIES-64]|nr:unnamed protein product [Closterium sp. NIES-64]